MECVDLNRDNKACRIVEPNMSEFIIHQYRKGSDGDIETGIFTAAQLYKRRNRNQYYYKVESYTDRPTEKKTDIHFGVKVSNMGSNAFDLGIYVNQLLNDSLPFCTSSKELLYLLNKNISFHCRDLQKISELSPTRFNKELSSFMNKYPFFTEIDDLREVHASAGLYLMVLDDYACCYIGQSTDIKRRIQQHWSKNSFVTTGIDMFKALDTTRIFVFCTDSVITQSDIDKFEYLFIHSFDRKYLLNILGGGGSLENIHSDSPYVDRK